MWPTFAHCESAVGFGLPRDDISRQIPNLPKVFHRITLALFKAERVSHCTAVLLCFANRHNSDRE